MKIERLGLSMLGCVLLFIGLVYPMVTVVMDDSPPEVYATAPADGVTYAIENINDLVSVQCRDLESGIKAVSFKLDGGVVYGLDFKTNAGNWEIWDMSNYSPIPISSGSHTFWFGIINNNDLTTEISGTFDVYIELQGKWYINNIEITDPNQVVRVTTKTLTFKFYKTQGIEDSAISCWYEYSGPSSGQTDMPNTAPNTWEQSQTFTAGGTYNFVLKANDGRTTVTMAIANIEMPGGSPEISPLLWRVSFIFVGILLIAVGVVRKKKK